MKSFDCVMGISSIPEIACKDKSNNDNVILLKIKNEPFGSKKYNITVSLVNESETLLAMSIYVDNKIHITHIARKYHDISIDDYRDIFDYMLYASVNRFINISNYYEHKTLISECPEEHSKIIISSALILTMIWRVCINSGISKSTFIDIIMDKILDIIDAYFDFNDNLTEYIDKPKSVIDFSNEKYWKIPKWGDV